MKLVINAIVTATAALLMCLAGCGKGQFPVRPAKGKVVANGTPVTYGTVTFIPVSESDALESGKPASGTVAADGTFTLSTFDRFDGAIVGKHRVQYAGPEDEEEEEEEDATELPEGEELSRPTSQAKKSSQTKYGISEELVVEVTASGPNDFTIEVQPTRR